MPPTGLAPVEANVEGGCDRTHSISFTTGTRPVGSGQFGFSQVSLCIVRGAPGAETNRTSFRSGDDHGDDYGLRQSRITKSTRFIVNTCSLEIKHVVSITSKWSV